MTHSRRSGTGCAHSLGSARTTAAATRWSAPPAVVSAFAAAGIFAMEKRVWIKHQARQDMEVRARSAPLTLHDVATDPARAHVKQMLYRVREAKTEPLTGADVRAAVGERAWVAT